ncbi:MAG: hypothetical protein J6M06_03990 [Synergistaceae bacterium]|nr:hypothetical protein [Synergistaceae bacterium]
MFRYDSDHIKVEGHRGTWYAIDESWARLTISANGKPSTIYAHVLLLEHETYGDMAANVIIDETGALLLDDVWNGFDDLDEAGWEIISEAEYTAHQPSEP